MGHTAIRTMVAGGIVAGGIAVGGVAAAGWNVDLDGDRSADVYVDVADQSGNSIIDVYAVDLNFDGVAEIFMYDTNENGYMDSFRVWTGGGWTVILDLDENGVADAGSHTVPIPMSGAGLIGPVTNPDWLYNLTTFAVSNGASPTFGPTDSDGDGYHDGIDRDPWSPFYA